MTIVDHMTIAIVCTVKGHKQCISQVVWIVHKTYGYVKENIFILIRTPKCLNSRYINAQNQRYTCSNNCYINVYK